MKKILAMVLVLTLAAALALPAAAEVEAKTLESEIRWLDFELPEDLAEQLQADQKAQANLFYIDFSQNDHPPVPGYYQLNYVESLELLSVEQVRSNGEAWVFDLKTGERTDYFKAYPLSEDLVTFSTDGGTRHYGLMNARGDILVEPVCSVPEDLGGGMYGMVSASGKEAYLVSAGEGVVKTFPFEKNFTFSRRVYGGEDEAWFCPVRRDGAAGLIDAQGEVRIPFGRYQNLSAPADGLVTAIDQDGRCGVLDTAGQTVIDFQYDNIIAVSEGLISVETGGLVGVLDTEGNEVIPLGNDFGYIGSFRQGLAEAETGGKWGIIDAEGRAVVPFQYVNVFLTGGTDDLLYIGVTDASGKMGLLDTEGREILPMEYDGFYTMSGGLFEVFQGDKCALVDGTGAYVLEPVSGDSIDAAGDVFVVNVRNHQITDGNDQVPAQVLDSQGKVLLDLREQDGRFFDYANEVFLVMEEGKYGLYSLHGGELLPLRYDAITPRDMDGDGIRETYLVAEGRRVGVLDPSAAKKYDTVGGQTPSSAPFPWIWAGIGGGAAIVLIAVVVTVAAVSRKKKTARAAAPAAPPAAPIQTPNFCTACGTKLNPGDNFCPGCGRKL